MATYTKFGLLSTTPSLVWAATKLKFVLLAAMLSLAGLQGCGGGSAQPPRPSAESEDPDNVLWGFADKGVRLELSASKDLNAYEDKAHSLLICVYQLDKRDAFDPLAGTQDGLETLLQCAPFDKSVKSSVRIFLQPGENAVHSLDRAEGAQFVGIACGFYESTPARSVRLLQIQPKKTESGHLFWKSTIYSAGTLDISLHLGANAVAEKDAGRQSPDGEEAGSKKADGKGAGSGGNQSKLPDVKSPGLNPGGIDNRRFDGKGTGSDGTDGKSAAGGGANAGRESACFNPHPAPSAG
ncbi:MAG: type VI secretion system lipoprotein TssJ [Desulfovibrio sp.]|jgi:type VI secretion system VasD/TssJ family lipoprotein|nr:type VI secretion system lipoprotein TssJ [Desulfovibrio sp.]